MYEQQRQAGEKSGLVRTTASKLADLLSNDINSLLADISNGSIGGIKLDPSTVQTILERATSSALETAIRSNAAMREIELRHKLRIEVEQARHANRLQQRQDRGGVTETDPDTMSVSELLKREGTQEEAISAVVLSRPPAHMTLGEWYERLTHKQRRAIISWFDTEIDFNSASEMDARYVFDNMS